jgi:hypothetical protein
LAVLKVQLGQHNDDEDDNNQWIGNKPMGAALNNNNDEEFQATGELNLWDEPLYVRRRSRK